MAKKREAMTEKEYSEDLKDMEVRFLNKYNRKPKMGIEKFEEKPSLVDRTGFMTVKQKVKQMKLAGITTTISKAHQFDTLNGDDVDITAPPFRGLPPDLADMAQMINDNVKRTEAIKQAHLEAFEEKKKAASKETGTAEHEDESASPAEASKGDKDQ